MRYSRAVAFENLRQALDLHGLLAGDDPWCEAIRQRTDVLRGRPLTRSEIWTITRLVEAVIGPEPAPEHGGEPGGRLPEDRGQQPKRGPKVGLN